MIKDDMRRDHEDYEELVARLSADLSRLVDHRQGLQHPSTAGYERFSAPIPCWKLIARRIGGQEDHERTSAIRSR